jgi:ABC-type phosphate/phosphonate transport system substrate-binding protein
MTPFVSLSMYALPEMVAANAAFWAAVRQSLREEGITEIPETIVPPTLDLPIGIAAGTLLSHMCGYPLLTLYPGQYEILAAPLHDLPGCTLDPNGTPTHRSFIVVAADSPFRELEELRGARFIMNGWHSNSGMNLPRHLVARLAREGRFFGSVTVSGAHVASMAAVAEGSADVAAIDCVTFGLVARHQPDDIARLRIIAETAASPAIPFITSAHTAPLLVGALSRVLTGADHRPALQEAMAGLSIRDIRPVTAEAYATVAAFEEEAAAMGYSTLA